MNTINGTRGNGPKLSIAVIGAAMSLAVLAVLLVLPGKAFAGQSYVHVLSSLQTVGPNNLDPDVLPTYKDANGNPVAYLKAARNEFESFQVYVRADAGGIANLRVDPGAPLQQIDPQTGNLIPGGASIPAKNLTFYREHFINIGDEAGEYPSDHEGALGEWADGLIPEKDYIYNQDRNAFPYKVNGGDRAVAWVDILVPPDQAPGIYKGTVLVKDDASPTPSNGGTVLSTIPVRIEVKNFGIPSESTLDSAFMQNYFFRSPCAGYPASVCDTTEKRWKLFSQYARVGLENRISIPSPWGMDGLADAPPAVGGSNDFTKYALPLINGMDSSLAYGVPGQSRLDGAKLTSVAAYWQCVEGSNTCLPAWKTLAEKYNFKDRFFLYACDEPNDHADLWAQCMANAQEARSVDPSLRTLIPATPQRAEAYGDPTKIDTIVPVVNHVDAFNCCGNPYIGLQRNTPSYTNFLAADHAGTGPNALWAYTSNMSHGSDDNSISPLWDGWPGYVIDQPDTQARAMGWMSFYYGLSGELYYQNTEKQATAWTNQSNAGGNGDGNLFYPGSIDKIGGPAGTEIPIESIRLKKIRDGREDYEYMHKLEQQGKEAQAKSIIGSAYRGGYGDQDYQTLCPTGSPRPSSPDGGCGDSAMYTTISAAAMESARSQLMDLVNPEPLNPPNTVIDSGPAEGSTMTGTTASFTFHAEPATGASFQCMLQPLQASFTSCASGQSYNGLTDGEYHFEVRAVNANGTDTTPATRNWAVNNPPLADTCLGVNTTRAGDDSANTISGLAATADTVDTRGGDDTVQNLSGEPNITDRFCGGTGNDTFEDELGGGSIAILDGGNDSAGVTDVASDTVSFLGWNSPPVGTTSGVDVRLTGGNPIRSGGGQAEAGGTIHALYNFSDVEGSQLDDTLEGSALNNALYGENGADHIMGLAGADYLSGGGGNDVINAADGVKDAVDCGDGAADEAMVDVGLDVVSNCELPDTVKPVVMPIAPKPGSTIRDHTPTIKANVSDNFTDLTKSNIKLYVRGTQISAAKFNYDSSTNLLVYKSSRIGSNRKTVKIIATDAAGNVGTKSWSFTIK